jgi:hypothetical protein
MFRDQTPVPKPSVPALIPLSLLEAIRNLDTPVEDGLDELAEEIVVRRLGLSPTVAAQIQRYRQSAERRASVDLDEAVSVFRLVARRADAALVFADAGRRAARYAARRRGAALTRLSQRLALRTVARLAGSVFDGQLESTADGVEIRMATPLSIVAVPGGEACVFYGAAYQELLRSLTGFEGALLHQHCRSRGDSECRWHTAIAEVHE